MSTEYIYNINYTDFEAELCALEFKILFDTNLGEKVFKSSKKVSPTVSPFLRNKIEVIYESDSYEDIVDQIKKNPLKAPNFLVKYVDLSPNDLGRTEKKAYCKGLGLHIIGFPSFESPENTFGIAHHEGTWYFGPLEERDPLWKRHLKKPKSYSSSLGLNLAKSLVNIAGQGDNKKTLIDPCCGAGTVLLEAVVAGYNIKGREINEKVAQDARDNLKHFAYDVQVDTGDIRDINEHYDACIVDLPYGNFSPTSESEVKHIIEHAARIADRLVLVSSKDIKAFIGEAGLKVEDSCLIHKKSTGGFSRTLWVCVK